MNPLAATNVLDMSILIPIITAVGVALTGKRPNVRDAWTVAGGISLTIAVLVLMQTREVAPGVGSEWAEVMPGLVIGFVVSPLGILFAMVASSLWVITTVYSIGYMRGRGEANQTRFYVCFSLSIAAAMGIAFSQNLFTLFIFYEVLTLATYPLVTHSGSASAMRGGRVYITMLLSTSIAFFLLAIIGTWLAAGTLEFAQGGIFSDETPSLITGTLLVLYVVGISKAAVLPFHAWLPAAMVAPTPVSALLHAVAVVKAGVFSILKIATDVFGLELLQTLSATQGLLYLAAATVMFGSIMALRQDNLKKRLAYSTVAQLSYIVIGALLATTAAVAGSAMHIAMHAFGKITLFFCAGAILVATQKTTVSEMRGLGHRMPITMGAFFIASLSVVGLPPTGGTWSKWHLISGAFQAEQWILAATLLLGSLLTIAYLLPVSVRAFFPVNTDVNRKSGVTEAPLPCLIALGVTATACIVFFFFPQGAYEIGLSIIASASGGSP